MLKIKRQNFLTSTMLVTPALALLVYSPMAQANCSVTSGTGTVAVPNNGDVINCVSAGGNQITKVGDGSSGVSATVNIENNASINVAVGDAVEIQDVTVNLSGDNSNISADGRGVFANSVNDNSNAVVTLSGNNASVTATTNNGIFSYNTGNGNANSIVTLSGDGSSINAYTGVDNRDRGIGSATSVVTLSGDNTSITGSSYNAAHNWNYDGAANSTVTLSGQNSSLDGEVGGFYAWTNGGTNNSTVTLSGKNVSVTSQNRTSVNHATNDPGGSINATVTLSGDNASISKFGTPNSGGVNAHGIRSKAGTGAGDSDLTVNLTGENTSITSDINALGVYNQSENSGNLDTTITLSGAASSITGGVNGVKTYSDAGGNSDLNITLSGKGSSIISQGTTVFNDSNNAGGDAKVTVTLSGDGSSIQSLNNGGYNINSHSDNGSGDAETTLTLSGNNTTLSGSRYGVNSFNTLNAASNATTTVVISGDNSSIDSSISGIGSWNTPTGGNSKTTVTLSGDNVSVTGGTYGTYSYSAGGTAQMLLTMGKGSSISGTSLRGVSVDGQGGVNPSSIIDSAGSIQGGINSILLDDGDDSVILRTGSNLTSPTGVEFGAGTDTLTLVGNGIEDELFLNGEILEVNANNAGWELDSANSFGNVNINTGTLRNNNNLTATNVLTISNGATYVGAGTTIGNVINNGNFSAGDNGFGTHTVTGNLSQSANGKIISSISAANTDLIDITGGVTLDGTASFKNDGGNVPTDGQITTFIQTTTGVAGNFSAVEDDFNFVDFTTQTVGNDVQLVATRSSITPAGNNSNQTSVASSIQQAVSSGNIPAELDNTINSVSNVSDFLSSQSNIVALSSLSASSAAIGKVNNIVRNRISKPVSLQKKMVLAKSLNQVTNPYSAFAYSNISPAAGKSSDYLLNDANVIKEKPQAPASRVYPDTKQNVYKVHEEESLTYQDVTPSQATSVANKSAWVQAVGGIGDVDGDDNARGVKYDTYGVVAGIDAYSQSLNTTVGAFTSYSRTNSEVDNLQDEAQSQAYQLGLYGSKDIKDGEWSVNGSVSGAYLNFETQRDTTNGRAESDFDGVGLFAHTETVHKLFDRKNTRIAGYVGAEGSLIYHDSYKETGAGVSNMTVESDYTSSLASLVGIQVEQDFYREEYVVTPSLRLGWKHEYLDQSPELDSSFSSAPNISFSAKGPEQDRDSLRIDADLTIGSYEDKLSTYINYDGDISFDHQSHDMTGGVKYKW